MTLLGVGVGAGAGGSSTLGRIGSGYIYADWVGQISYASPNWNGFSFNVGMREPWTNGNVGTDRNNLGFEGKVAYDWAGDVSGKVWAEYVNQKHEGTTPGYDSYTSDAWGIGGKVAVSGFGLVGYYYDGRGVDSNTTGGVVSGLEFLGGNKSQDSGGYVQGTYTIAAANNLKIGLSWGESQTQSDINGVYDIKNESWIIGAYYPLTKSLNLVAEYTDQKVKNHDAPSTADELKAKTLALGAILFF
jgi:predicted porin